MAPTLAMTALLLFSALTINFVVDAAEQPKGILAGEEEGPRLKRDVAAAAAKLQGPPLRQPRRPWHQWEPRQRREAMNWAAPPPIWNQPGFRSQAVRMFELPPPPAPLNGGRFARRALPPPPPPPSG